MTAPAPDDAGGIPEWAYAAALAGLAYMTWDRLAGLLGAARPAEAWRRVRAGAAGPAWARAASSTSVEAVAGAHLRAGVRVRLLGDPDYPGILAQDHEAPPVLFSVGSLEALDRPRVGMVGTRRTTGYGRDVAQELGRDLAQAGVAVVSGLAAGIDGASHEGALAGLVGPPVAVVGSGLDVAYPRHHKGLWRQVADVGLVLSEAPLGARPEPWRFPARNRIIAALSHVLVVVESHAAGGSFHTVRAAAERGVPVMAVPGPVRSPASAGTNRLLAEGCAPACEAADVLAALSLETAGTAPRPDRRPAPSPEDVPVLDAVGWEATSTEQVLVRTGLTPSRLAVALTHLEVAGWVRNLGGWWERAAPGD
ncbi:MAG: DNA-processing protein DprA [Actinomycetota bacterium]|nr:DNA-processing protein DprA [Actinomycetota bacterium]